MRSRPIVWMAAALVLAGLSLGWPMSDQAVPPAPGGTGLSAEQEEVVDYLLKDWKKQFRSTSIPVAMSNLGVEPNDDLRLAIGEYFRENTQLANNLKWWGANNYILSDQEKLIAKHLIGIHEEEQRLPGLQQLSAGLGLSEERVRGRLAFMVRAGLLEESGQEELGYALAERYERWGGPLRHNFHTVTVEGEKPFGVWWAVDFLLLVNSDKYRDKKLSIEDSCAHCSDRISVEIDKGKIVSLEPETVYVQQGGGWAVDNLFRSEEHLNLWLKKHRAYKRLTHLPLGEFLEKVKSGDLS